MVKHRSAALVRSVRWQWWRDKPSRDGVQPDWARRHWPRRAGMVADAGMATAEYAIATVAAVGFAGLLVVIMRSDEVRELLMGIIRSALHV